MAQFILKMIDWVVNDIVVKHLANSKSFQRFALKTDTVIQEHSKRVYYCHHYISNIVPGK